MVTAQRTKWCRLLARANRIIVEGKAASLTSDVLLRKHIEKQIARFVDEGGGQRVVVKSA